MFIIQRHFSDVMSKMWITLCYLLQISALNCIEILQEISEFRLVTFIFNITDRFGKTHSDYS